MPAPHAAIRDIVAVPEREAEDRPAGQGRLIAVVVGIDRYADPAVAELACSVNDAESVANAIRQAHPAESLELIVLLHPARDGAGDVPTRQQILDAFERAAATATADDTVLFYFAGHGGMIEGRPSLFPVDLEVSPAESGPALGSYVRIDELQAIFARSPCTRKAMFVDCCQSNFSQRNGPAPAEDLLPVGVRGLQWRTGLPVSSSMVGAFQQLPAGWVIVLACGPGEVSLEDPEWGEHGIFSHFLADGLRGKADLDGDGLVSLAELSQYLADRVPKQAEAVGKVHQEQRGLPQAAARRQTPTLLWGGPISFPLTRALAEGHAGLRAGIVPLWLRFIFGPLPYPLAVEPMARFGVAALYGAAMALAVVHYALSVGQNSWLPLAAGIGLASVIVWLASYGMAAAANEIRWHSGGYYSGAIAVAWHVAVFILVLWWWPAAWDAAGPAWPAFRLGVDLAVLVSLLVVFGYNAAQCLIALATLVKKDDRVVLRRAFLHLDRAWIHAEVPNVIAMVSAHPKLYQWVGLACCLLLLGHAGSLLVGGPGQAEAVDAARDFLLIVLVQWQVQWVNASYYKLRRIILPQR